jgi:hypothetical protein
MEIPLVRFKIKLADVLDTYVTILLKNCYHFVPFPKMFIPLYKTIIFVLVLYGFEAQSLIVMEEHKVQIIFEVLTTMPKIITLLLKATPCGLVDSYQDTFVNYKFLKKVHKKIFPPKE